MKTCPKCGTQYTDETLRFCLQDGAVLGDSPATQQPTVSLADQEFETAVRRDAEAQEGSVATQWKQKSGETQAASLTAGKGNSRLILILAGVGAILLLSIGAAALGIWLYFRDPGKNSANLNGNGNGNFRGNAANVTPTPAATRTPIASPTPSATITGANTDKNANTGPVWINPTDEEKQRISREVTQQIYNWRSDTESGDIDSQMGKYASSVDYYRRNNATREFIRADKMRAYRMYDSIDVTISAVNVTVGPLGETATAVFDKEWVFEGSRRSTGKVRQQLQFRRIDGRWLITGERDLRVYYTK